MSTIYRTGPASVIALTATLLVFSLRSDLASQATEVWLVGAGDIADCRNEGGDREASRRTRALLDYIRDTAAATGTPVAIFTVGDNSYRAGDGAFSVTCYEYPIYPITGINSLKGWGRHKSITYPAPGNHDYQNPYPNGERYHAYFGSDFSYGPSPVEACKAPGASNPRTGPPWDPFSTIQCAGETGKGWYTFRFGDWRIVVLNSERVDAEQVEWFEAVLRSEPSRACTLAIWHHPRFSSGAHGDHLSVEPLWDVLRSNGGDVLISAHDHDYERFSTSMWADGTTDNPPAVRQFVVGTGGAIPYGLGSVSAALSRYVLTGTHGVLLLKLRSNDYDSAFHWISEDYQIGEVDSQTGLWCR